MGSPRQAKGLRSRAAAHRLTLRALCTVAALGTALGATASGASAASVSATTIFSSPGETSFTVPIGTSTLDVTAVGGKGGRGDGADASEGGFGAIVTGSLAVSSGEELPLLVAGNGGGGGNVNGAPGGAGFGGSGGSAGNAGGGGGGATIVGEPFSPDSRGRGWRIRGRQLRRRRRQRWSGRDKRGLRGRRGLWWERRLRRQGL